MGNEPLVKGGCGHSAGECQFSGMVAGIGFLLVLAVGAGSLICG